MTNRLQNRKVKRLKGLLTSVCGFSLIELVVAIGLFGVITAIAVGGFARALRTQRQAQLLLSANSNVSEAIEVIAREVRVGRGFQILGGDTKLAFTNPRGEKAIYFLDNNAVKRVFIVISGLIGFGQEGRITSDNVRVERLSFELFGNNANNAQDGYPPRVTIRIAAAPSSTDPALAGSVINMQTTVSARLMDDVPAALLVQKVVLDSNAGGTNTPENFKMAVIGSKARPCAPLATYPGLSDDDRTDALQKLEEPGAQCSALVAGLQGNKADQICVFSGSNAGTWTFLAEGQYCVDELLPPGSYAKFPDRNCKGTIRVGDKITCVFQNAAVDLHGP